jgi:hypothetical protein
MASAPFEMAQASAGHYDKAAAMTTGLRSAFTPCVERRRGRAYALFVVNHRPLEEDETTRWQGQGLGLLAVRESRRSFAVETAQVELIAPRVLLTSGWSLGAMTGRGPLRQIEPSLGHGRQVRAVGEAGGGVRELETKQGELPILILLDHGVHSPNSETRLPG